MTQETTKLPDYRADIDGLRALAVMSVVLFHAFPNFMKGGYVGVDVFFVISGFLITKIIVDALDDDRFSFVDFYSRRAKRIFPALIVVLSSALLAGYFTFLATEYRDLGKHTAAGAGFISNFVLLGEAGYFDASADIKPLLHLWSLGVEEQFYLVWPVLLWAASRGRLPFGALAVILGVISFTININQTASNAVAAFYSPHTRFWELLSGASLAIASRRGANRIFEQVARYRSALASFGLFLLLICVFALRKMAAFPGGWAALPVLGAVLLIASGPKAWVNRVVFSHPLLVSVGLISFPLYLWHWPMLSFARVLDGQTPTLAARSVAVVLSVFLAYATYKLLERPIRFGSERAIKTALLIFLLALTGFIGYMVKTNGGYPERAVAVSLSPLAEIYSQHQNGVFFDEACLKYFPGQEDKLSACRISKDAPPQVLLIGDSHSYHYYEGLAQTLGNASVIHLARWSCLPFATSAHFDKDDCRVVARAVEAFLDKTSSIKVVVVAGHWSYLSSGGFAVENDEFRLPRKASPGAADTFLSHGRSFFEIAQSANRRVVLMKDNPSLGFGIRSCYESRLPFSGHPRRAFCGLERSSYEATYKDYAATIEALAGQFPKLLVFDPLSVLCDAIRCYADAQGKPLYIDSDHLSSFGARQVVSAMVNSLNIQDYLR